MSGAWLPARPASWHGTQITDLHLEQGGTTVTMTINAMDVEEIKVLSHRYALGLDRFDLDMLMSIFTDDATFDAEPFGLGVSTGRDAIRELFVHNQETMASQMHLFSNHIVEFKGVDVAVGTSYLLEEGYAKTGELIRCLCLNEDRYRRTVDGWKLEHRTVHPLVPPQMEGY